MKLAVVDRDGTIVDVFRDEETGSISVAFHPDQLRFLEGAVEGLRLLQGGGYTLAIATNQPAPAKGQFSAQAVQRTNEALVERLGAEGVRIARVEVCLHHPTGGPGGDPSLVGPCECRKPKPGMIEAAMRALGAERGSTWMIGDARADLEAARAARVGAALVFPLNRCELCPLRDGPPGPPDVHGATLAEVARQILLAKS